MSGVFGFYCHVSATQKGTVRGEVNPELFIQRQVDSRVREDHFYNISESDSANFRAL